MDVRAREGGDGAEGVRGDCGLREPGQTGRCREKGASVRMAQPALHSACLQQTLTGLGPSIGDVQGSSATGSYILVKEGRWVENRKMVSK